MGSGSRSAIPLTMRSRKLSFEEMLPTAPDLGVRVPYRDHESPERALHSTFKQQDNPDPKTYS